MTGFWIRNKAATVVVTFACILFGMASYRSLAPEANPDVPIPFVIVQTLYLGVSPSDIESLVTNPIERELKGVKGVKKMTSTSYEGASVVSLEFQPDVNIDDALQKVRDKVSRAKSDLPTDAEDSEVFEVNFSDFPVIYVTMNAPYDLAKLKEVAKDVQEEIETLPGVLEVKLTGGIEREIQVQLDPDRLAYYKLAPNDVINAIKGENINVPGGNIDIGASKYLLRTPAEYKDPALIADIVIHKDGAQSAIRVRDVGEVVDTFKDRTTISRLDTRSAITLKVSKRTGENIVRIIDKVKDRMDELKEGFPEGTSFTYLNDQSTFVRRMITDLENNIYTGLVLVLAIIFAFMGLREALIVSTAIPFSMLLTFIGIQFMGWTLNIVVLFALILALGMLVDNAIVIVENIQRHIKEGRTNDDGAQTATDEVAIPVITSTVTTLAAFAPLLFWPGIVGEFMKYMPGVVIIALTASTVVALTLNPAFSAMFLKVVRRNKLGDVEDPANPAIPDNFVYKAYGKTLASAIRHPILVNAGIFAFMIVTVMIYGKYNYGVQFFPETTPEQINITIKGPDGQNLETTDALAREVEAVVKPQANVKHFIANVGAAGDDMSGSAEVPHMASLSVDFFTDDEAKEDANQTIARLREGLKDLTGAEITIKKQENGPPVGAPIAIELVGESIDILTELTRQTRDAIGSVPGVVDLKDDLNRGKPEIQIVVDREAAQRVGASTNAIANAIRTAFNGTEASKYREGKDEYDITVILKRDARATIDDLRGISVPGKDGIPVPLSEVAKVVSDSGFGSIKHRDRKRVVTVQSDVEGRLADVVLKDVLAKVNAIDFPKGYYFKVAGESEDQEITQKFLGNAFLIAIAGIFMTLVLQFNSVLIPLIIMSSIVLSMAGVLWGLLLTKTPFGIVMTGIGVISLAGVAVNNAIVLIDYTEELRRKGLDKPKAIVVAGLTRLRPVFLTAATTIIGLIPMAGKFSFNFYTGRFEFGGQSAEFWQPMAVAVIFGLILTTFLTLVIVPTMYSGLTTISEWMQAKLAFLFPTGAVDAVPEVDAGVPDAVAGAARVSEREAEPAPVAASAQSV
jgi:multidrug efflux pump